MSLKTVLFVAAALAFAGAAQAHEVYASAKLEAPVPHKVKFLADHAVWVCEADSCIATITQKVSLQGCKDLAKRVGAVSVYGPEAKPLSPDEIASCNAGAPATLQAAK